MDHLHLCTSMHLLTLLFYYCCCCTVCTALLFSYSAIFIVASVRNKLIHCPRVAAASCAQRNANKPCDLDLWPMTLNSNRVRAVVKVQFKQNLVEQSAAVNELSCVQRKKTPTQAKQSDSPSLYRADSDKPELNPIGPCSAKLRDPHTNFQTLM